MGPIVTQEVFDEYLRLKEQEDLEARVDGCLWE